MSAPKITMVLPVRFSFETRAVQTTTRELSADGVFVRCIEPPPPGAQVALKLYLPGLASAADFIGVIREVQPGKGEGGFWADFVSADLDAHERLLAVLFPPAVKPKAEPAGPVPLGSLYKRAHVQSKPPSQPQLEVEPPAAPAEPAAAAPPAKGRSQPGKPKAAGAVKKSSGVGDLIQESLDSVVAEKAAAALAVKRASQPGKRKTPVPAPLVQAVGPAQASAHGGPAPLSGPSDAAPVESRNDVVLAGDSINRRAFPRYRARFAVRFSSVQDFVLEYAANISAGGVFVTTNHPPEMDTVITVVLELPGGGEPVNCKALVVHRVTVEQGRERDTPAGVGVQFIEADDQFRERIDRAIGLILGEGGV